MKPSSFLIILCAALTLFGRAALAEELILDEPLMYGSTTGDRYGGTFKGPLGWSADSDVNYIKFTLAKKIMCGGYMEVEVTNFQPGMQVPEKSPQNPDFGVARILAAFGGGAQSPADAELFQTGYVALKTFAWTDTYHGNGLMLSASSQGYCGIKEDYATKNTVWDASMFYKFRIEWDGALVKLLAYSRASRTVEWQQFLTYDRIYMHNCAYPIDTVFLGRDNGNTGQAGPIYSNLKVGDLQTCSLGPCQCTGTQGSCSCRAGTWPDGDVESEIESEYESDVDFITESFVVYTKADSKVSQANPYVNYGTAQWMDVSGATSNSFIAYMKFEIPDEGLEIIGGKIHLYNKMTGSSGEGGDVYATANTWTENEITFMNRPVEAGDKLATIGSVPPKSWILSGFGVDVSSAVKAPGVYSFMIESSSSMGVAYSTKEDPSKDSQNNAVWPYMEVFFKPPPGTGDDAKIISHTIPTDMVAGSYTQVSVTVENNGVTDWTMFDFQLTSPNGSDPFATAVQYIQTSGGVPAGQQYTFSFIMKAPKDPNTYTTIWQMNHRNVKFFGEKLTQEVNVIAATGSEDFVKIYPSNATQWMFNKHVFFPRFIDSDALLSMGELEIKNYLDDVATKGFNGVRAKMIWIKPSSGPYAGAADSAWPFAGTPSNPQLAQLNFDYFDKLANVLNYMKDKGMVADLTLLSCGLDYSKGYTNEMRAYVDYAVVKFRNQPNLYYELADEYNNPCFAGGLTDSFITQMLSRIRANDPDHLVTISGKISYSAAYPSSSWNQALMINMPYTSDWYLQFADTFSAYSSVIKPIVVFKTPVSATDDEIATLYSGSSISVSSDAAAFTRGLWIAALLGGSMNFAAHKGLTAQTGDMPGADAYSVQKQLFDLYVIPDAMVTPKPGRLTDAGDGKAFEALLGTTYALYLIRGNASTMLSFNYPAGSYQLLWYDPLLGLKVSEDLRALSAGAKVAVPDGMGDLVLFIRAAAIPDGDEEIDAEPEVEEESADEQILEDEVIDGDDEAEDETAEEEIIEEAAQEDDVSEIERPADEDVEPEDELETADDEQAVEDENASEIEEAKEYDIDAQKCGQVNVTRCTAALDKIERCTSSLFWQVAETCEADQVCDIETVKCVAKPKKKSGGGGCGQGAAEASLIAMALIAAFGRRGLLLKKRAI